MIKYIVFDFDGTLADSLSFIKEIAYEEFENVSDHDFDVLREEGVGALIKERKIRFWNLPKTVLKLTSRMTNVQGINLFPEVIDSLLVLSQSYKLGIVSSNSEKNIFDNLKKHNVHHLFDFIFSQSSLFGKDKVLKKMCKKHQIHHSEVIYVGDEDRDIVAAKKAKIKNIAVSWGYNSKNKLRQLNPDFLVNSPKEMVSYLS
jgi:phosphoglycolate phosphatase-like HAD superfamily hydrolase